MSSRAHNIQVLRTARIVVRGDPTTASEVWFLLHGYAQLANAMLESCRVLEAQQRLLVAPEALSRFYVRGGEGAIGATWMTREERDAEIADYVRYLDRVAEWTERELDCRARTRVVLGFSQGAKTAWRWVAHGNTPFARVIGWGSDVPPDLELETQRARLAATRLQVVRGDRDPVHTAEMVARDRERFARAQLACEFVEFVGAHALDNVVLERLIEPHAP